MGAAVLDVFRLERPFGYLRADPAPPIIVGGFGPRMAAIAERHGDGFNTQAQHPRLADLLQIAGPSMLPRGRTSQIRGGRVRGSGGPLAQGDSVGRAALARLGVDRLILLAGPPFDAGQIRAPGRQLTR